MDALLSPVLDLPPHTAATRHFPRQRLMWYWRVPRAMQPYLYLFNRNLNRNRNFFK